MLEKHKVPKIHFVYITSLEIQTPFESFQKMIPYSYESMKTKHLNKRIVKMIVKACVQFSILKDEEFLMNVHKC